MFTNYLNLEAERKHGIDKLDILIHFMPLLEGNKVEKNFNRLKSYIVSQIKRGITKQEEVNLMEGIVKYVQSEPGTNERMKSMIYLFNLEFLLTSEQGTTAG
jgi:hypothetical protein